METLPVVITKVDNNIGWVKLNRPHVLNSLNLEVIELLKKALDRWKNDDNVALVCIYGEGEKGLCAGGDMRTLYDLKEDGVEAYAEAFFTKEYKLDYKIHHYPKPIIVNMNGIVMGGGVGLSVGASHRIVTEKTKWAMPEMNIGFFPDVGASYFLNKMPGYIGRYLALTAQVIKASDVLYAGAADYYLQSENWQKLMTELSERSWTTHNTTSELNDLLDCICTSTIPSATIDLQQEKIDLHFKHDTIEEIILSLEKSNSKNDNWTEQTLNTLLSKSPTSLKVTLHQLIEGKSKTLNECFKMEKTMAMKFMETPDFYEGVRAVLVDKDRSPKWNPSEIKEVTEEEINIYFAE